MKLTYRQLVSSIGAFNELQELRLTPKMALDIYKLGKELERELAAYRELSSKIYLQYGATTTPESGGLDTSTIKSEDYPKLGEDMDELLDSECEIKDYAIPMESFEKFSLNISPRMIGSLEWLLFPEKEEEPKATKTAKTAK